MNRNRQSRYATGIVQEGIAQQISMLEPGDDSAISSEDDIGAHAKQTLEALRTAELLLAPSTSSSRPFLRHFPDSDARPLFTVIFTEKLATEKLQNIGTYVQRIHLASIMSSSVDALMNGRICDYFDRITQCLDLLTRRLHEYPSVGSNSPAVLHALEDFVRSANEWIVDIPGPAVFLLNEDSLVSSISVSSPTTLVPSSNALISKDGICPLERAMITRLGIARKQFYHLEAFTHWARDESNSSVIRSQVGSFRSAHLLRERGSLHHEYVIISFGGNDRSVPQSWLRAERAPANMKKHWYTPNQESSSPLLGGATLRESISFASSKGDLRLDEDDELASVIVDNGHVTHSSRTMLLNGLADQFAALTNTSQRYHLLPENCRWYARRNILSIAEHLIAAGVSHRTCWLGQSCIVEMLHQKLGDEPSGGQLEGLKGMLPRIRGSLDHAWSLIVHGNASEALPLCTEALTMLEGAKPNVHYPPFSLSLAWSVYGCALHDLDCLEEALDAHQKACAISRSIREQESQLFLLSHGALATTLHRMGRQSEAVNVWRELVDARRRIHRAHDNLESTHGLAQALTNYASVLTELPKRHGHCVRALGEATVLWRRLAGQRSDLYRSGLQGALSLYAEALDHAGRSTEASAIKREISSLQPVATRRTMAKGLYSRAKSEAALGNWENAFAACKESVEQFRLLFDESPNEYHTHVTEALDCLFDYRGLVKPSSNAVEACEEAISFYRLQSTNSQEYFGRLAEWFIDYSSVLDALGRTTEAFESSLEAIAVSRQEFALRPRVFRRNIASCLFNHAIYAAKLERWSDAVEADQESVKHRRHLYEHNPSGYRDRLALGLANLGLHYHGAGMHLEAFRTWDEAVNLYRILYHSDRERYRAHLKALLNRVADLIDTRGITPAIVPTLKISNPDSLRQEAEAVERGTQRKRWGIGKLVRKRYNSVV